MASRFATTRLVCATILALCARDVQALKSPTTGRRAAVGTGLTAVLGGSLPAFAKDSTAKALASGYEVQKSNAQLKFEAAAKVFDPFESALAKRDASAMASLYTSDAKLIDGTKKPLATVEGASSIGEYLAQAGLGNPQIGISKLVGERNYDGSSIKVIHTQYTFEADGGVKFSGYCRLVAADGASWKIDREAFPLEAGKIYAMLKPKRDVLGNVYMQVE